MWQHWREATKRCLPCTPGTPLCTPGTPLWIISACSNYCTEQESNIRSTTSQVATNISLKGMMIKLIFMVHFPNEMPPWNVNQIWQSICRKILHEKKAKLYTPLMTTCEWSLKMETQQKGRRPVVFVNVVKYDTRHSVCTISFDFHRTLWDRYDSSLFHNWKLRLRKAKYLTQVTDLVKLYNLGIHIQVCKTPLLSSFSPYLTAERDYVYLKLFWVYRLVSG